MSPSSVLKLAILLISLFGVSLAQLDSDYCFVNGECRNSPYIAEGNVDTQEDCRLSCANNMDCTHFTFYDNSASPTLSNRCILFTACLDFSNTTCSNCYSGKKDCIEYSCYFKGRCLGILVNGGPAEDEGECLQACKDFVDCNWFTFDKNNYFCSMVDSCDDSDQTGNSAYISGQSQCPVKEEPNRIIVMTGNNHNVEPFLNRTTDVEAIDLARLDTTCTKPADTPIPVSGAFTFWYQDKIWLCGGTQKTLTSSEKKNDCNSYDPTTNIWKDEVDMLVERGHAVAVEAAHEEIWILGGQDNDGRPRTSTEIFKDGAFISGPELPEPMSHFCTARLNSTHLFVVSGMTFDIGLNMTINSNKSYLLNLKPKTWYELPNLDTETYHDACGIIKDDNGRMELVVGGTGLGREVQMMDLSSSSLQWVRGPDLPEPLKSPSNVQFKNYFLLLGGNNEELDVSVNTIYRFDSDRTWKRLAQTMQIARQSHNAVALDEQLVSCT